MGMNIIIGRNNGLPCIAELKDLPSSSDMTSPFPEHIMMCNGGLPYLDTPHKGTRAAFTDLAVKMKNTDHLYFNGHEITAAYMDGEERLRARFTE